MLREGNKGVQLEIRNLNFCSLRARRLLRFPISWVWSALCCNMYVCVTSMFVVQRILRKRMCGLHLDKTGINSAFVAVVQTSYSLAVIVRDGSECVLVVSVVAMAKEHIGTLAVVHIL